MLSNEINLFRNTYIIIVMLLPMIVFSTESQGNVNEESPILNLNTLKRVQIVFRHGISVPEVDIFYPLDPYIDQSSWPASWGHLTKDGEYYQFKLGQYLRKRYRGFLSEDFVDGEIGVLSSDSPSCKTSLQMLLLGMYPQYSGPDAVNTSLSFDNFLNDIYSIYAIPPEEDNILKLSKRCDKWDDLYSRYKTSYTPVHKLSYSYVNDEGQMVYTNFADYILEHSGLDGNDLDNFRKLHTILTTQKLCNMTIPKWADSLLDEEIFKHVLQCAYNVLIFTEEMEKLQGGPLLTMILNNFKSPEDKNRPKMHIYSGHAVVINTLHTILTNWTLPESNPEFSGAFILEQHKIGDHLYIKVFYRSELDEQEYSIELGLGKPLNGSKCWDVEVTNCIYNFVDFEKLTIPYTIENYSDECSLTDINEPLLPFPIPELLSVFILFALFPVILYIFVKILYKIRVQSEEFSPLLRTHKVF